MLLAVSLVLVSASTAFALSYKTGDYAAGTSDGDGVTMHVSRGSFSVSRISFQETCTSSNDSFKDRFAFVKGSAAKLTGKIGKKGHFSGTYKSGAGTVKVSGKVKGHKATVTGTESGDYTPSSSTTTYKCKGSHTFHAKRSG
jgi:hypothetical protein